jgi:CheY-like chemotaxis protein
VLLTSLEKNPAPTELSAAGICDAVSKPLRVSQLFDAMTRGATAAKGMPSKAPASSPTREKAAARPMALRPAKLLLAEDNEVNQIVASEILQKAGFVVDVVPDGSAAVRAVQEKQYDLVLMDCHMPVMDGFRAASEIRKAESEQIASGGKGGRLPIIALTANALKSDREECIAAGMDDFVSKPLHRDGLIELLNRYVGGGVIQSVKARTTESQPSAETALPIDMASLLDRCMGDEGLRARLLDRFAVQAGELLRQITQAANADGLAQLKLYSHTLKGSAANMSAAALMERATKIESLAKAGQVNDVSAELSHLAMEIDRCVRFVQNVPGAPPPTNKPAAACTTNDRA